LLQIIAEGQATRYELAHCVVNNCVDLLVIERIVGQFYLKIAEKYACFVGLYVILQFFEKFS